jgi:hypothetical protein
MRSWLFSCSRRCVATPALVPPPPRDVSALVDHHKTEPKGICTESGCAIQGQQDLACVTACSAFIMGLRCSITLCYK